MENKPTRGGKREGAGRKAKEKTVTTCFRVHEESLKICKTAKIPLSMEVNTLIKSLAEKTKN